MNTKFFFNLQNLHENGFRPVETFEWAPLENAEIQMDSLRQCAETEVGEAELDPRMELDLPRQLNRTYCPRRGQRFQNACQAWYHWTKKWSQEMMQYQGYSGSIWWSNWFQYKDRRFRVVLFLKYPLEMDSFDPPDLLLPVTNSVGIFNKFNF